MYICRHLLGRFLWGQSWLCDWTCLKALRQSGQNILHICILAEFIYGQINGAKADIEIWPNL
jgi:hypothetical protein